MSCTHTHTAHTYTHSHTHTHTLSHTHTSLEASSKRATADAAHNYCRFVKLSALAWVAFPPLPSPYLPLPQYVKFFAPLPLSFCGFADTCVRQPKENFAAVPIIFSFASFFFSSSSCFSFSPSASAVGATFSLQPRPLPPLASWCVLFSFFFFFFYCCRSCCRCQLRFIYNLIIYRLLRGRRDALLLRHVCCVNAKGRGWGEWEWKWQKERQISRLRQGWRKLGRQAAKLRIRRVGCAEGACK